MILSPHTFERFSVGPQSLKMLKIDADAFLYVICMHAIQKKQIFSANVLYTLLYKRDEYFYIEN